MYNKYRSLMTKCKRSVNTKLKAAGFKIVPTYIVRTLNDSSLLYDTAGFYTCMSQFHGKISMVVNVPYLIQKYTYDCDRQIELTIAHELAHSFAEKIRVSLGSHEEYTGPNWQDYFSDEEMFCELFAMYLVDGGIRQAIFWPDFIASMNNLQKA